MPPEQGGAEKEVSMWRRPNGVSGQRAPMTPPLFILGMIKAIQPVKITIFVFTRVEFSVLGLRMSVGTVRLVLSSLRWFLGMKVFDSWGAR